MTDEDGEGFAARVQSRLERLELTAGAVAVAAGLPAALVARLAAGEGPPLRGRRLVRLADALETSVAYLVGLDPDAAVPEEYLAEDQGDLGLLAGDEEALLLAYRRLDVSSRAALLQVVRKMAPEPVADERRPRQDAAGRRRAPQPN